MNTLLGILALVAGVAFPMGMVVWLAMRMGRKPWPSSRLVFLVLAFNGVLPLGLILFGLGQLRPELWSNAVIRFGAYAALLAAVVLFVLLLAGRNAPASAGGRDA